MIDKNILLYRKVWRYSVRIYLCELILSTSQMLTCLIYIIYLKHQVQNRWLMINQWKTNQWWNREQGIDWLAWHKPPFCFHEKYEILVWVWLEIIIKVFLILPNRAKGLDDTQILYYNITNAMHIFLPSISEKRLSFVVKRKSQPKAIWNPPPKQSPCILWFEEKQEIQHRCHE